MVVAIIDIFNGDADGICALHQLRLANPQDSVLITGIKRDIALVAKVAPQQGDQLTILDENTQVNTAPLDYKCRDDIDTC